MKKLQNKKVLIAGIVLIGFAAVGGTFAFMNTSVPFENVFKLGAYEVDYTETFSSPSNWSPCDVTPKSVTVTNKGSIAVGARIKYTESWKATDDSDLPLVAEDKNGNEFSLATPKLINLDKWLYDGSEYYYYYKELQPNETTVPFIESVTFNCETNFVNEEITYTNTETGKEGRSSENDYLSSTYHLNINIQTIQRDKQLDAWGTVPTPSNP